MGRQEIGRSEIRCVADPEFGSPSRIAQSPVNQGGLCGRSAAGNERPIDTVGNGDRCRVHPLSAGGADLLLVFLESGMERPERVAEEAMCGVTFGRLRRGAYEMSGLVVTENDRAAGEVVRPFIMGQSARAGKQTEQDERRDAGTSNPRLRAEHRFELSGHLCRRQAAPRYARRRSARGCTRAIRMSVPWTGSPSTWNSIGSRERIVTSRTRLALMPACW